MVLTNSKEDKIINNNLHYDNVTFENINRFHPNIIICQYVYENIGKFKNINKETLIYVWCHHDIIVSFIKNYFKSCLNYIDKFIFVSKCVKNRYIKI